MIQRKTGKLGALKKVGSGYVVQSRTVSRSLPNPAKVTTRQGVFRVEALKELDSDKAKLKERSVYPVSETDKAKPRHGNAT